MTKRITDAELRELLRIVAEHGGNQTKAATVLGMNRNTLTSRLSDANIRGIKLSTERDPLAAAKYEIKTLRKSIDTIIKENINANAVKKEIYGLIKEPVPPGWLLDEKKVGRKARAGIPFFHWSDWHYGEVTTLAGTAGANEYNREIAKKRIRALVEGSIRLARGFAFREDASPPPGVVVALNGDIISGDIHEELRETNEVPPFVCVSELFDILVWAIKTLKGQFGKVFVPCTVGNHGRTTLKPRAKNRVYLSYEWNLYKQLEKYFQDDPDIVVMVSDNTDLLYKVNGHAFLQTHGDALGVKGGDGIIGALGPIARGAIKLRNSEYKIGRDFDYMIIGHYHQDLWIGRTFVNGCLCGYNEYARLMLRAEPSRASQQVWFVHPEHGVTARLPVYVDVGEPIAVQGERPKWLEVLA